MEETGEERDHRDRKGSSKSLKVYLTLDVAIVVLGLSGRLISCTRAKLTASTGTSADVTEIASGCSTVVVPPEGGGDRAAEGEAAEATTTLDSSAKGPASDAGGETDSDCTAFPGAARESFSDTWTAAATSCEGLFRTESTVKLLFCETGAATDPAAAADAPVKKSCTPCSSSAPRVTVCCECGSCGGGG